MRQGEVPSGVSWDDLNNYLDPRKDSEEATRKLDLSYVKSSKSADHSKDSSQRDIRESEGAVPVFGRGAEEGACPSDCSPSQQQVPPAGEPQWPAKTKTDENLQQPSQVPLASKGLGCGFGCFGGKVLRNGSVPRRESQEVSHQMASDSRRI